jgi:hypothetical protein
MKLAWSWLGSFAGQGQISDHRAGPIEIESLSRLPARRGTRPPTASVHRRPRPGGGSGGSPARCDFGLPVSSEVSSCITFSRKPAACSEDRIVRTLAANLLTISASLTVLRATPARQPFVPEGVAVFGGDLQPAGMTERRAHRFQALILERRDAWHKTERGGVGQLVFGVLADRCISVQGDHRETVEQVHLRRRDPGWLKQLSFSLWQRHPLRPDAPKRMPPCSTPSMTLRAACDGWPSALIDPACARQPAGMQVGTEGWISQSGGFRLSRSSRWLVQAVGSFKRLVR